MAAAAATSWTAMPVESNTMTSSLDWRGGARPATIWPSSVAASRVITTATIAWCRSPIVAAWSSTSTTTRLAASSAGAISCFSGLSAPTAATKTPGATSSTSRIGCRADVQVTTMSLLGAAAIAIVDARRGEGPHAPQGSQLDPSLVAAPDDRRGSGVWARQVLGRDGCCGTGPQRRDLHGIEQRQGRAHLGVGEDDHALDRGEAPRGVVREVGVGFRREVGPAEAQRA